MRRLRPTLVLSILVLAAVWVAAGSGNHDPQQPIPGNWDVTASATEPAGTITFEVVSREVGEPAIGAIYPVPPGYCVAGSEYYLGSFTRGGDSGTLAGCGPAYGPIFAQYRSGTGLVRRFVVTLVSGTLSASDCLIVNTVTNQCEPRERFTATFAGHLESAPPEEPPPEEPPEKRFKCLSAAATIIADVGAPPGTPIAGTEGKDVIVGTAGPDTILGGGGIDLICGKGGDDMIDAGDGLDFIAGEGGSDVIRGGGGTDDIEGGPGNDRLYGERDGDVLDGGPGNDVLLGEDGADILRGGPGNDAMDGGTGGERKYSGGDRVSYADSRSAVAVDLTAARATGEGRDRLIRIEFVLGSEFNDELRGSSSQDYLAGGGGKDRIFGGGEADDLIGGDGDDRLAGGDGNDELFGGPDDDVLLGGPGPNDLAEGDEGTDSCRAERRRLCERIAVGPGVG